MELLLKELTSFGLSSYEAKCYTVLIRKREMTAVEISKIGGVPRSRIYEVLENLLHKGLCSSVHGPVVKYRGVDPKALKNRYEHNLEKIKKQIENSKNKFAEGVKTRDKTVAVLSNIFKQGQEHDNTDPLNHIETFKDRLQMLHRYSELILNAREELLTVEQPSGNWTPPPQEEYDQWLEESSNTAKELIKRNVKVRGIYELSDESERRKWQLRLMEKFVDTGENVRIAKELPMKVSTIDSRIVMVMLEDQLTEKPSYTSQIIYHRGMAKTIKMAFETMWAYAEDFNEYIKKDNQKKKG